MRIDVVIANPPYNNCQSHNGRIGDKITEEIKNKHPQKYIQIQPINSKMKYKTSEFVCNPFGIRWSNIFIFDMLGNINEYFSFKEIPLWDKNSNKTLWMLENPTKVVLTETDDETTKRRFKIKDNQETKDFYTMDEYKHESTVFHKIYKNNIAIKIHVQSFMGDLQ